MKSDTTELENQMADAQLLADLAFLTDMTSHLNELNLKLQGKQQNIANLFGHINGFKNKIKLFNCKEHFEEMKDFEEVSYLPHIKHIGTIAEEFKNRFSDFKKIESDISVFTQPLPISLENVSRADLQLELCDLQSDPFYQGRTEIGLDFFKLLPGERYPNLMIGKHSSVDYLKFGFIPSLPDKQSPMCLLCNKVLGNNAMKPSKLQDHLRRCHPDKTEKDLKYFQTLKDKFQQRPTLDRMFASTSQRNDDGLRASYNISLLISKSGKPHTIGEKLILPAVEEVLKTDLHKPASDIIKRIPLSNNTVERRIFLCNYLQTTHIYIQLDESTLPDNAGLLLTYVRFIMKDYFIEKAIPLSNIISVATDGAPAMDYFIGKAIPLSNIISVATDYIHRQHLVAKNVSVRLHESLHLVIDAVNRIRSNALNMRSCVKKMTNTFINHSFTLKYAVCRKAFTILEFLDTKDKILKENLMKRKTDIAYLTDLFTKFNMVNLQLQGDSLDLIKTKSILSAFLARVKLMKQNIGRGQFSQFPNLSQTSCQEDDVSTYVQHLNALYLDFESRFEDILTMLIPPWIINPYDDIEETNVIIQEELTELSTNEELKVQFKNGYQQFWLQNNIPVTYPVLWNIAMKFLISFPSSYLVERGFSAVTNLLTTKRNRLDIIS
ncbi:unnamed protein product [Acanthoscelides obtectus]|uniref:SCAN domain-containing protein 3 n=1 Tax=Acanthoscelides obtectus TaxID=200917 RepID=A0A9P0LFS0_ACAOB|nr:unnamed protein product [Acanthoscelides obtectus]CAK1664170.1 SCAN domain-containing protein 3 [Acanthoscelides obtectus]